MAEILAVVHAATAVTAQADPGPGSPSASAGEHRASAAKSVFRHYGGWAVEQDAREQTLPSASKSVSPRTRAASAPR